MRVLAVIAAACVLLAPAAWAQSLGSADPSQQLKTVGPNMFQSSTTTTFQAQEKKEPLVTGTAEATGDAAPSEASSGAQASAPAPAPEPSPAPVRATAAVRGWNPASSTSVDAQATAGPQTEHMQKIMELVEQIRRRRDSR